MLISEHGRWQILRVERTFSFIRYSRVYHKSITFILIILIHLTCIWHLVNLQFRWINITWTSTDPKGVIQNQTWQDGPWGRENVNTMNILKNPSEFEWHLGGIWSTYYPLFVGINSHWILNRTRRASREASRHKIW